MSGLLYALGSNISFASASIYFTKYGHRLGAARMNFVKAAVAFMAFCLMNLILKSSFQIEAQSVGLLIVSGLVGLAIGDIFLIRAFTELGSGRVLMIFGFEPVILGIFGYFLFGEKLLWNQVLAIVLLVACLISLSFYMKAVQIGPVATVSAIAGTSPLFATLVETLRDHRRATLQLNLALIEGTEFRRLGPMSPLFSGS